VFVKKVFEQYSNNGSTVIAVKDFYNLLKALRIGQIYDVHHTNGAAVESPDINKKQMNEQDSKERKVRSILNRTFLPSIQNTSNNDTATHEQKCHNNVSTYTFIKSHIKYINTATAS
jgi:hypothetical protein